MGDLYTEEAKPSTTQKERSIGRVGFDRSNQTHCCRTSHPTLNGYSKLDNRSSVEPLHFKIGF